MRPATETPAIPGLPGRVPRRSAFPQQRRHRSGEPDFPARLSLRREQDGVLPVNQRGVEIRRRKRGRAHQAIQECDVVRDADNADFIKGSAHPCQGQLACFVPDDELGNHRVVVRRNFIARGDSGIHAHMARWRRRGEVFQSPDRRQETALRILSVNAGLERVAVHL